MRIERVGDGIKFMVKVQPGASRTEIVGIKDECLKIKVTTPPVGGKANKECVKLLAQWLGIKTWQIEIEKGAVSRMKKVKITGESENLIKKFKNLTRLL